MTPSEIFDIWAPPGSPWSPWVKPVLFAQGMARTIVIPPDLSQPGQLTSYSPTAYAQTAIVVDLPGAASVRTGLSLATAGFRPVPLYNCCCAEFHEVVHVAGIVEALRTGTETLQQLSLPPSAPPVFLLDSLRMRELAPVTPGQFDNRWMTVPQDFPSAAFLREQQILRVLLVQQDVTQPLSDLAHVLLRWQEAGLTIEVVSADMGQGIQPLVVQKPPRYRALWYHVLALLGLSRNSAGGFGEIVPQPSSGGYG